MASKKASKGKDGGVNKSALIRKYPGIPAGEVVAKIKADHGVSVSAPLVYAIRSADKGKGGSVAKGAKVGRTISTGLGGGFDAAIKQAVRQAVRDELKSLFNKL